MARGSVEPWLTKQELARELRVSLRTITRLNPPHTRVGGQNRYRLSEVEAALHGVPSEGGDVIRLPRRGPGGEAA
jgi:hypothetical protein